MEILTLVADTENPLHWCCGKIQAQCEWAFWRPRTTKARQYFQDLPAAGRMTSPHPAATILSQGAAVLYLPSSSASIGFASIRPMHTPGTY